VRLDQVTGSQSAHQAEFASHDRSDDDTCESPGVLSRVGRVSASDAEHLQHGVLWREDGSTADGPNLDRRHRAGDSKVLTIVDPVAGAKRWV
jgi:hypothetical protein